MSMTTIKKLSFAGVLLLGTAGIAAAAPAIVESDLNLRAGPSTGYGVVAVMPGGASVDVLNCTGSWCRVGFGGTVGYASRSYLDVGGAAYAAPVYAAPVYGPVYEEPYYRAPYYAGPAFGVGIHIGGGGHHWRGGGHHWRGGGHHGGGSHHGGGHHDGGHHGGWHHH